MFANDYVGTVEISGEDDTLELRMGPAPLVFPLTQFERDTFAYRIDREPPAPRTGPTFVIGPDGLAQALILDYFEGNGQPMFPRIEEG